MRPTGVASAAWVFASAPSTVPFYVAGVLLVGWAVLLAATGITRPDFPRSRSRGRLVMLTSVLLVGATLTAAVTTSSRPGGEPKASSGRAPSPGAAGQASTLQLTADPTGAPAYEQKQATAKAGKLAIEFVNRSPVGHNVTIASGTRVVAATKTIQGATTAVSANLPPGTYDYFCSVDAHRQAGMQGKLTVR
jgi:plastocyanin